MRILTVVHSLDLGGIESFLLNVFGALDKPDLQLEVCCTGGRVGLLAPEVRRLGIEVWCCPFRRNALSFRRRFRRELQRRQPFDVVHGHVGHYCGPSLMAAQQAGVHVRLAHYHNLHPGHKNDWMRRMYDRWMKHMVRRSATGILACSWAALRAHYRDQWKSDERMEVIRLGVPVTALQNADAREEVRNEFRIAPGARLIGHIGSFRAQKNHSTLVEVARRVVDRRPNVRFLLVGDGPLRSQVFDQVRRCGLCSYVTFAAQRRDVPRLLSAMDLLVLPSLSEGFSLVLIEAQCAGVPVVASAAPWAWEAVAPAFHTYLRDPFDVTGMAEAILALLEDAERDPSLSEQARVFGSQFTIEASAAAMLAAWGYPGAVAPPDPCEPGLRYLVITHILRGMPRRGD